MTIEHKTMTADELWMLPEDGRLRELVRGEVIMMAPAGGDHGEIAMLLGSALTVHVKAKRLGKVVAAETGFILARNPDTVRAPDAAFIASGRVPPEGLPTKFIPFAPDIAVEVLSPSDTQLDIEEKIEDWLTAGTGLVWVVNPRRKTVTVHQAGRDPRVLRSGDMLEGGEVCPGFAVRVGELFAE